MKQTPTYCTWKQLSRPHQASSALDFILCPTCFKTLVKTFICNENILILISEFRSSLIHFNVFKAALIATIRSRVSDWWIDVRTDTHSWWITNVNALFLLFTLRLSVQTRNSCCCEKPSRLVQSCLWLIRSPVLRSGGQPVSSVIFLYLHFRS